MVNRSWFVLPPAMEYYYKTKNYEYRGLPPYRRDCSVAGNGLAMELIYPRDGARIYILKIFWHLDGSYVGVTQDFHQMALSPAAGAHTLTLVDAMGNAIKIRFTVLDKAKGN